MKTELKKLEHAEVEIKVVLPVAQLEKHRNDVEEEAIKHIKIDGFREGHVPREMAMKNIQPMRVFEEMAQRAISSAYVDILEQTKVKAIGHPQIMITKIAEGTDLEFTITTAVLPEITLGDYKKIAKTVMAEKEDIELSDAEITSAIDTIRKMRAQQVMSEQAQEGDQPVSWKDIKLEDLPELTDEFVKTIGAFENVADFEAKIKENLVAEKTAKATDKKRISIIDTLLEQSDIEVPNMMIDYEVEKMLHEFEGNIAMTGMAFTDYLKSINKTRDDYRAEWAEQGKKRAQTQLMLNEIAGKENIEASDTDIETEVSKIMEHYKDQKNIDENNVRAYVASVLTHQKVFEFLEGK
jgi:FKBP-type peptidyl-prolyl cis-trans isomerase (trigger factor)